MDPERIGMLCVWLELASRRAWRNHYALILFISIRFECKRTISFRNGTQIYNPFSFLQISTKNIFKIMA
jgi:hypothetical protein